ncbi:MAG: class I SAM-dependent methyltransferase [Nitrospinota bacterium]|nr:class I SAM-dependent methyltransferase [Nitrospinota bacterium]
MTSVKKASAKWDKSAPGFDKFSVGVEKRYGRFKKEWFSRCRGRVMLVAVGTGLDLPYIPDNVELTAVDFSEKMLEEAGKKIRRTGRGVKLLHADVQELGVKDRSFDTIVTSCTFCSVPDPVKGLRELHRVMKDDGTLLMFEHVRPSNLLLGTMMDIMAPLISLMGPDINRRTGENVEKAGFRITREYNIYLDMVKLFEARKRV